MKQREPPLKRLLFMYSFFSVNVQEIMRSLSMNLPAFVLSSASYAYFRTAHLLGKQADIIEGLRLKS